MSRGWSGGGRARRGGGEWRRGAGEAGAAETVQIVVGAAGARAASGRWKKGVSPRVSETIGTLDWWLGERVRRRRAS